MYIIENTKNNLSATVATKVDQQRGPSSDSGWEDDNKA